MLSFKNDPFVRTLIFSFLLAVVVSLAVLSAAARAADFKSIEGAQLDSLQKAAVSKAPVIGKYYPTFTALTYNIQGASTIFKIGKIGAHVKTINADFVFLSEAVKGNILYPDQPACIARAAGFKYTAFKGNERVWTQIEMLGNAILSKTPLYEIKLVDLPKIEKKSEPRGLVAAKTKFKGREIALIAVHLSRIGYKNERRKQIEFLASFINSNYKNIPVIMAGDFNTSQTDDVWGPLNAFMDEGFLSLVSKKIVSANAGNTIPVNAPNVKFDYIFATRAFVEFTGARVSPSTLSDHRPFYATGKLK